MNANAAFEKYLRRDFPNASLAQRVELRAVFMAGRRSHQRDVALAAERARKIQTVDAVRAIPFRLSQRLTRSE